MFRLIRGFAPVYMSDMRIGQSPTSIPTPQIGKKHEAPAPTTPPTGEEQRIQTKRLLDLIQDKVAIHHGTDVLSSQEHNQVAELLKKTAQHGYIPTGTEIKTLLAITKKLSAHLQGKPEDITRKFVIVGRGFGIKSCEDLCKLRTQLTDRVGKYQEQIRKREQEGNPSAAQALRTELGHVQMQLLAVKERLAEKYGHVKTVVKYDQFPPVQERQKRQELNTAMLESCIRDPVRAQQVARDPQTPPEVLQELAKSGDHTTKMAIANNPNAPAKALEVLAKAKDPDVNKALLKNSNTSLETLKALRYDGDQTVRTEAKQLVTSADNLVKARGCNNAYESIKLMLKEKPLLEQRGLLTHDDRILLADLEYNLAQKKVPPLTANEQTQLNRLLDKVVKQLGVTSAVGGQLKTTQQSAPEFIWKASIIDMKGVTLGGKKDEITGAVRSSQTAIEEQVKNNPDLAYALTTLPEDQIKAYIRAAVKVKNPDLFVNKPDTDLPRILHVDKQGLDKISQVKEKNGAQLDQVVNGIYDTMIGAIPNKRDPSGTFFTIGGETYTVGKKLGSGGFGTTFLLTGGEPPRQVVAKCIGKQELDKDPVLKELEAHRYAVGRDDLHHPNIAGFLGVARAHNGDTWLLQECVAGKSFTDVQSEINKDDKLSIEDKSLAQKYIMKQIVTGMAHVQDRGMLHLDMKPDNVMIDSDTLTAKIIDFGTGTTTRRGDTQRVGTSLYMAPEVVSSDDYDQHADVWSLGAMLFQSQHEKGWVPLQKDNKTTEKGGDFGFETVTRQWADDKTQRIFPPHEDGTPLSPKEELLNAMLHPDPKQRPTVSDVLKHPFFQMSEEEEARAQQIIKDQLAKK